MNNLSLTQKIAVGFGAVYFLVGILGFIPGVTVMPSMTGDTMAGNGDILGLFGITAVHNVAHLLFGLVLIFGGMNAQWFVPAMRTLLAIFIILLVAQFIQPLVDLLALNWWDFGLHLASAAIIGFLAFAPANQPTAARMS